MPSRSLSDIEAFRQIRPKSAEEKRSGLRILTFLFVTVVIVVGLFFLQLHSAHVREQTWVSAPGMIVEARPRIVADIGSERGGGMLYQVEVRVRYSGAKHEEDRWLTLSRSPEGFGQAQLDSYRFKGAMCIVRWPPAHPENATTDIS